MGLTISQVDAFTDKPFAGNPAAVCVLPGPADERWMQDIAREMNLSETAFLHRRGDGFELRWFAPITEVDLCGHATLATAHILWEEGHLDAQETARFHTRSGLLTAAKQGKWIELDFPAEPDNPADAPPELLRALAVKPNYVGRNRFDYLLEVDSEEVLRKLRPDWNLLMTVPTRGVIVTSPSDSAAYDFVVRFFAPRAGINEDPVTGSAYCCLGPHWGRRLGRAEFVAYQASERGGTVQVRVGRDRVYIAGQAVTILRGELL